MEYRVLGSLEVLVPEGSLELRGAKERAVLALLLANIGRSVSADEIVDGVWGDRPPASAFRSLHVRISKLRRLLEPQRAPRSASVIAKDGAGYRLAAEPDAVDAEQLDRLVSSAREADPLLCLAKADQALGLLRGEPYGEFGYLDFAQPQIRRLNELALEARELRLSALVRLGRHAEALPGLGRLVEQHPEREPLTRLLMLALYRSGRHVDALAAYRALFERLNALGLEPEEESRRLERQILQRAPDLEAGGPSRTNIGVRLTSFVGREEERSLVLDRLGEHRLVTLAGTGGVGKTSLAAEVARGALSEYPDGVWLVELAPLREPACVAEAVADALGLCTPELDRQASSTAGLLQNHLRRRKLLLVLDNCEHVVSSASAFAVSLLSSCPEVRLLATSRERLGVPGEALVDLEPLTLPSVDCAPAELADGDAVRLFIERARMVRDDLELDDETLRGIAEVCVRLDGLPLALELAAARVRILSLPEIAERLADRFALLGRGPETIAERQRTLAGVVDWSYQLLTEQEQMLFRRLSVFPSLFGLEAAEEVCSGDGIDPAQVADLLAALVDRSMVVSSAQGLDRFRLLETLREFGRAQADARAQRHAVGRRHAVWAARIAEAGHSRLWSEGLEAGTRSFHPRRADLETAAELALELRDADLALALTAALGLLGFLFAGANDYRASVEAALALPGGALERRLRALRSQAALLMREGRPSEAIEVARAGLRIAEQARDAAEIARMQTVVFLARLKAGDTNAAPEDLAGAEDYAVRHRERFFEGMLHHFRGLAAFASSDVAEARSRAERALDAFAASGDLWGIVNASEILGHSLAAVGEYDKAMEVYERALDAGVRGLYADAVPLLYYYGLSRLRAGDTEAAARLFGECDELAQSQVPFVRWHGAMGEAHLARRRGDLREASDAFDRALSLARESVAGGLDTRAVRVALTITLRELGHLLEEHGDVDGARRRQEESLAWARLVGEPRLLARSLDGLAGALSLGDRAYEAAGLLGVADATRTAARAPLPEGERDEVARIARRLRNGLGIEQFEAELARGRSEPLSLTDSAAGASPL
jgi:predicted ATPase/DNA-binding SARP family transcriptional activator